jgi:hypothetical protein
MTWAFGRRLIRAGPVVLNAEDARNRDSGILLEIVS